MTRTKNLSFFYRAKHAWTGIRHAWSTEASLRTQSLGALAAFALLVFLRPEPIWWALVALTSGAVLAAELVNTALELVIDRLHPEMHPMMGRAKDCAAGAVLLLSVAALAVAGALVLHSFST